MKIWSISFLLLFGSIEFYQWLRAIQIPLPIYIGLGLLLAIASNATKTEKSIPPSTSDPVSSSDPVPKIIPKPPQPKNEISFKINRPTTHNPAPDPPKREDS